MKILKNNNTWNLTLTKETESEQSFYTELQQKNVTPADRCADICSGKDATECYGVSIWSASIVRVFQ